MEERLAKNPKMFTTNEINLILALANSFIPFPRLNIHVEKFCCCCVRVYVREFFLFLGMLFVHRSSLVCCQFEKFSEKEKKRAVEKSKFYKLSQTSKTKICICIWLCIHRIQFIQDV